MTGKIIGWALIICSITEFLVVLIYLIRNPLATPFWFPIAFFATVLPFNIGFYYIYSNRNKTYR